jgi:hypothetical protein
LEQQNRENQRKAEINRRNTEIIAKFIVEHIEPLLRAQALAGLSKTMYSFVPYGTEQEKLRGIIAQNQNIVEGFSGGDKSGPYISTFKTKEYVKIIRLIKPEYSLEFWQQTAVVKELEQTLKLRLQANGEKLAETATNSAGRPWRSRSFYDGETLLPGYTGVGLVILPTKQLTDPSHAKFLCLFVEIA